MRRFKWRIIRFHFSSQIYAENRKFHSPSIACKRAHYNLVQTRWRRSRTGAGGPKSQVKQLRNQHLKYSHFRPNTTGLINAPKCQSPLARRRLHTNNKADDWRGRSACLHLACACTIGVTHRCDRKGAREKCSHLQKGDPPLKKKKLWKKKTNGLAWG